jgi:hypothetical protein
LDHEELMLDDDDAFLADIGIGNNAPFDLYIVASKLNMRNYQKTRPNSASSK